MFSLPNIFRIIKIRTVGLEGCVAYMRNLRCLYNFDPESGREKRSRRRWNDNMKMSVKNVESVWILSCGTLLPTIVILRVS
jgi:hypothetical protein